MTRVAVALARALPAMFHPRVVGLVLLPLVGAALLWLVVGYFAWQPLTQAIASRVPVASWLAPVVGGAAALIALLLLAAAALVTLVVAISTVAMPVLTSVAASSIPALDKRHGGTFGGSLANAIVAVAIWLPLWLASLVLLVVPPVGFAVSWLLAAWFNARLLRYDALADHASAAEMRAIFSRARLRLFALGLALVPLALVPFANLVAPLYAGLAFAYLCLAELAEIRSADAAHEDNASR